MNERAVKFYTVRIQHKANFTYVYMCYLFIYTCTQCIDKQKSYGLDIVIIIIVSGLCCFCEKEKKIGVATLIVGRLAVDRLKGIVCKLKQRTKLKRFLKCTCFITLMYVYMYIYKYIYCKSTDC